MAPCNLQSPVLRICSWHSSDRHLVTSTWRTTTEFQITFVQDFQAPCRWHDLYQKGSAQRVLVLKVGRSDNESSTCFPVKTLPKLRFPKETRHMPCHGQASNIEELGSIRDGEVDSGGRMPLLRTIFGVVGNITAVALFLSPLPTYKKIWQNGSTGDFSAMPYFSSFLNCILWVWYGLPFVTKNNTLLVTINSIGAAIEIVYICIFIAFTQAHKKIKYLATLVAILLVCGLTVAISMGALHQERRKLFVGVICVALTIAMYASPLSIMRLVITTKSVQYMPFYLSLFVFINTIVWGLYGLSGDRDIFIIIPNTVGCFLGLCQLILYILYRSSQPQTQTATNGDLEATPQKQKSIDQPLGNVVQKLDKPNCNNQR